MKSKSQGNHALMAMVPLGGCATTGEDAGDVQNSQLLPQRFFHRGHGLPSGASWPAGFRSAFK